MTGPSENLAAKRGKALTGLAEAHERYDAVLCDIWGVLHNGGAPSRRRRGAAQYSPLGRR